MCVTNVGHGYPLSTPGLHDRFRPCVHHTMPRTIIALLAAVVQSVVRPNSSRFPSKHVFRPVFPSPLHPLLSTHQLSGHHTLGSANGCHPCARGTLRRKGTVFESTSQRPRTRLSWWGCSRATAVVVVVRRMSPFSGRKSIQRSRKRWCQVRSLLLGSALGDHVNASSRELQP